MEETDPDAVRPRPADRNATAIESRTPTMKRTPRSRPQRSIARPVCLALSLVPVITSHLVGGQLTVNLANDGQVTRVAALQRWDQDGNPRRPVDPKAKFEQPRVAARAARQAAGRWVFENLPAGRYDLLIQCKKRVRIEGFHYPPVLEFDPFLLHGAEPAEDVKKTILDDVAQSRHYENKVTVLYLAGDDKVVRVLVQLLRDKPTSYDGQFGEQVATLRHEVWQYTEKYGAWTKEKRTRVLDRVLAAKREVRSWTWVWEPDLGGITVEPTGRKSITFRVPDQFAADSARGLLPE